MGYEVIECACRVGIDGLCEGHQAMRDATSAPAVTYKRGQAVHFRDVPAVILSHRARAGQLEIATFAGMTSWIGTQHSQIAPLDESEISPVFAARIAEIRTYYKI